MYSQREVSNMGSTVTFLGSLGGRGGRVRSEEGGVVVGTRIFFLSTGVPDPTPGLGVQAKSPQCSDTLVAPTCATHPCFLEKCSSPVGSCLVLSLQGPARRAEAWTVRTPGNGFRGHNPSLMCQDPGADQACGAVSDS